MFSELRTLFPPFALVLLIARWRIFEKWPSVSPEADIFGSSPLLTWLTILNTMILVNAPHNDSGSEFSISRDVPEKEGKSFRTCVCSLIGRILVRTIPRSLFIDFWSSDPEWGQSWKAWIDITHLFSNRWICNFIVWRKSVSYCEPKNLIHCNRPDCGVSDFQLFDPQVRAKFEFLKRHYYQIYEFETLKHDTRGTSARLQHIIILYFRSHDPEMRSKLKNATRIMW